MTTPPRFVPTLTDVVEGSIDRVSQVETGNALDAKAFQRQLVQRVLQRVDIALERRLREAVGELILEHTQNLAPLLRQQIENTVQDAVSVALAQEIDSASTPQ